MNEPQSNSKPESQTDPGVADPLAADIGTALSNEKEAPQGVRKVKGSRIEAILARVFLAILSFIIFFAVAELASRIFLSKSHSPIEDEFPALMDVRHPEPYVMFGAIPHARNLNNLGYRGHMPTMPKNPTEFRIFMLGGSTVLLGKPPIAGWLEYEFQNAGHPNVKVYNYGVISSVSGMELARIVYEISELQPDLILMYNGGNDILMPWETDPRPGYPYNFVVMESNPLYESTPKSYPAFALFAYGSNLLRYFLGDQFEEYFLHLKELRKQTGWKSEPWREEIADSYVSNLVKASKVSAAFGAEFMACFQPMVYYKKTLSEEEEEKAFVQDAETKEEAAYALDMRTRIISKLKHVPKTTTLNWIDLSRIYENKTQRIFTDEIHTTDEAKRPVARAIYRHIDKLWGQRIAASTPPAQGS